MPNSYCMYETTALRAAPELFYSWLDYQLIDKNYVNLM